MRFDLFTVVAFAAYPDASRAAVASVTLVSFRRPSVGRVCKGFYER